MKCVWVIVTVLFFASGCEEEEKPQGSVIHFYPLTNVYFDKENDRYLQYDSSKKEWRKIKAADFKERNLGADTIIPSPVDPVYTENQDHRIIYGTALYTDYDQLTKKYIQDSLASKPVPKKSPTNKQTKEEKEEEEKKSKFQKWLDKVFN